MPDKREEKWDEVLSGRLLDQAYAARALDVDGAWAWLRNRRVRPAGSAPLGDLVTVPALRAPDPVPHGPRIALGEAPFAVVDVETTGLAAGRGHRIVEIAIVRCRPDGSVEDFWHTLLDPQRDVGPSHIHGLTMLDVVGAPRFGDVAGHVAERLRDRVVVAHNAPFDMGFLQAEFDRVGASLPEVPTLCTMALIDRVGSASGRSLADACAAFGIPLQEAHSAREDALATAALLQVQLSQLPAADFAELGVRTLHLPGPWPELATMGHAHPRSRPAPRTTPEAVGWTSAGETAYADALTLALEDGQIDSLEIDSLIGVARTWTLDAPTVAVIARRLTGELDQTSQDRLAVVERTVRSMVSAEEFVD